MSDTINREDAIEAVVCHIWHMPNETYRLFNCENVVREVVEDAINRLPSSDRPTGEWLVGDAWPHNVYCSNCYATFAQEHWEVWEDGRLPRNFCPNCGAKMKGENNESNNSTGCHNNESDSY